MTVEQREFTERYIETSHKRNEDDYLKLIHPKVRSCMSANLTRFVQDEFLTKAKHFENIQRNFVRIEQIEMVEIEAGIKKYYRDKAFLPVEPKYILTAPVKRKPNKCGEVTGILLAEIPIAFDQGQWYEVLPCGKNDLDQFLGKQLNAKAIQAQRTNDMYDKINPKTWNALRPILTEEKNKPAAIKYLQENENLSRSKATTIVQKFCDQ